MHHVFHENPSSKEPSKNRGNLLQQIPPVDTMKNALFSYALVALSAAASAQGPPQQEAAVETRNFSTRNNNRQKVRNTS